MEIKSEPESSESEKPKKQTKYTRSKTQNKLNEVVYSESSGFKPGILPTKKDVIQTMMYLLRPARAGKSQRTTEEATRMLSYLLIDHWELCTIYTIKVRSTIKLVITFNFISIGTSCGQEDNQTLLHIQRKCADQTPKADTKLEIKNGGLQQGNGRTFRYFHS